MKIKLPAVQNLSFRELPDNLAALFRSGARGDLLGNVDLSLLLFENRLVNTANGVYRELEPAEDRAGRAAAIAAAARSLAPGGGQQNPSVLLLLPPTEFVATHYQMALNGEKLVRSALQLQAHSLIPAYEDELQLGVNAASNQGVALWYPTARADELFEAFEKQGLFLAALMPRSLALAGDEEEAQRRQLIRDGDAGNITLLLVEKGAIRNLLTVSRRDLEQEAFARQWEQAEASLRAERENVCESLEDWSSLRRQVKCLASYCFLPRGSLARGHALEAKRRRVLGAGAAAAALLLLCIPFIANWLQIQSLERRVENMRETAAQAIELQDDVLAMEDEWGPLYDFPEQDVGAVLLALNEFIEYSLTRFSINRGVVDIEGYAQDPAMLIAELAAREEFYNVEQIRSISGGNSSSRGYRFGIRMNLTGADFAAYEREYPLQNGR